MVRNRIIPTLYRVSHPYERIDHTEHGSSSEPAVNEVVVGMPKAFAFSDVERVFGEHIFRWRRLPGIQTLVWGLACHGRMAGELAVGQLRLAEETRELEMTASILQQVLPALHEEPAFQVGERVRVAMRAPIGHYRVPIYLRGSAGQVERVIEPALVDNEEEGYGRNAGGKRHYYRVAIPMPALWEPYEGSRRDELHVEIYETWLERA